MSNQLIVCGRPSPMQMFFSSKNEIYNEFQFWQRLFGGFSVRTKIKIVSVFHAIYIIIYHLHTLSLCNEKRFGFALSYLFSLQLMLNKIVKPAPITSPYPNHSNNINCYLPQSWWFYSTWHLHAFDCRSGCLIKQNDHSSVCLWLFSLVCTSQQTSVECIKFNYPGLDM